MTEVKGELAAAGDEGEHECEMWAQGSDGADEFKGCKKYPLHDGFMSVKEFSLQHLPEPFRDKNVLEAIQRMSELTVRLRVKYTSTARPHNYVYSEKRGKRIVHKGSGLVCIDPLLITDKPCPCPECSPSSKPPECSPPSKPQREWWKVIIQTARHVVYDKEEAANTVVDIYDNDDNKYDTKSMFGLDVVAGFVWADIIKFECVTHDKALGQNLLLASKHFQKLKSLIFEKFCNRRQYRWCIIIVSYPHGYFKRITVGEKKIRKTYFKKKKQRMMKAKRAVEEWSRYFYTTPTCKGCSGAPVLTLGRDYYTSGKRCDNFIHIHSGSSRSGLNKSSIVPEWIAFE